MKLLEVNEDIKALQNNIANQVSGDYIYMYPPRQAYGKLDPDMAFNLVLKSLNRSPELNLYFHVPFCQQICSFCNLYTKVLNDKDEMGAYVGLLMREMELYRAHITGKKINTLYLGGGTPSLLEPQYFQQLFHFLGKNDIADITHIPEVAIEAAPDTVTVEKFSGYKEIGINRVNLGFQTLENAELHGIGRRHDVAVLENAIKIIKNVAFNNVCIDLIYGLQYQSMQSWINSVSAVIDYDPETICIYPLTLREATPYKKRGYTSLNGEEQYQKYDYAVNQLLKAGYYQETHIRFMKGNGGYLQKENHWKLENIIGFGAGARSYLWHIDTRNGYSALNRVKTYKDYIDNISDGRIPITDGFVMNEDERIRKAVILNLIYLRRDWFRGLFGIDVLAAFPLLHEIEQIGLLTIDDDFLGLTEQGLKYRDLIVQCFFGDEVIARIQQYKYND